MSRSRNRPAGFTLVEILIVVVILGILAAIVVSLFSDATENARATNTQALLKTVRIQLELYKVEHDNEYPTLVQMWDNLLLATDDKGNIDPAGDFGPYLMKAPLNQYTLSETIVAIGAGTANDGWEYDENTGAIHAVGFDEETDTYTAPAAP